MKKVLLVLLLSISNPSGAEIRLYGNAELAQGTAVYERPGDIQLVQNANPASDQKGRDLFNEVLYLIRGHYYKEVGLSDCIPKILIGGVSECTDRYSYYFDPVEAKEEQESFLAGELVGIGATLEINKDGGVKVIDVIESSPAEKAGLQADDVIIALSSDGNAHLEKWKFIGKMPLDQVVKIIRGPKGSGINLLIVRKGERKKLSAIRDTVKIQFLKSKVLKDGVGYVRILSFGGEVSAQFYRAMLELESAGVRSVIIDLRNNPGGKLDSVINMCAWFAKTDSDYAAVLYMKERNAPLQDAGAGGSGVGRFKDMRVVVLQNSNSASASEIFSGYLQSETGATVIGEKSFGKGIVQKVIPLTNNGALHLTTAEYFIGRKLIKVHDIGISPNIEVKQSKPAKDGQGDEQLQRAIQEAEKLLK